jgi:hypothetical protein
MLSAQYKTCSPVSNNLGKMATRAIRTRILYVSLTSEKTEKRGNGIQSIEIDQLWVEIATSYEKILSKDI